MLRENRKEVLREICSNGAAMGNNKVKRQGKTDPMHNISKRDVSATPESFKI